MKIVCELPCLQNPPDDMKFIKLILIIVYDNHTEDFANRAILYFNLIFSNTVFVIQIANYFRKYSDRDSFQEIRDNLDR